MIWGEGSGERSGSLRFAEDGCVLLAWARSLARGKVYVRSYWTGQGLQGACTECEHELVSGTTWKHKFEEPATQ